MTADRSDGGARIVLVGADRPTAVRLPFKLLGSAGALTADACCAVAAIMIGAVGWWVSGTAVAVPVALVGGVAVAAAVTDARSGRIPNGHVLTGVIVVACSWGFVSTLDDRLMQPLGTDLLAGAGLGGAPAVFAVWLVAPHLIGGGDWKLLLVLGAAVGAVAPTAASLIPVVAFAAAIVAATVRRRRTIRLGPFLALGYVVTVTMAIAEPAWFGSWYAGASST